MSEDYEVGYGKPPKSGQFKPGQSGNKKGRPKGRKNFHTILEEVASKKVVIKENDKITKMDKRTAAATTAMNMAAKGNLKAFALVTPLLIQQDERNKQKDLLNARTSVEDKEILEILSKNYVKEEEERSND